MKRRLAVSIIVIVAGIISRGPDICTSLWASRSWSRIESRPPRGSEIRIIAAWRPSWFQT
jgi:hypothetical protein